LKNLKKMYFFKKEKLLKICLIILLKLKLNLYFSKSNCQV
jgi:hypothetical protein